MILVVSHPADDHARGVLDALSRAGHPAAMLDTAAFPRGASIAQRFDADGASFSYRADGQTIDLDACRAAWWRRPQQYTLHDGLDSAAAEFAYTECHEAIAGLWPALRAVWVNRPELDEVAHHKPYQLAVARTVGLPIPRTVITNDPAVAREFVAAVGLDRTVYKTFLATERHWRETRILRHEEEPMLDQVRLAPVIFQEFVDGDCDVRATVIGDRIIAAAITAPAGGYGADYRMEMETACFEPVDLPARTERGILELMRRLGLIYGAVDLRRTPAGEYIFLEINPAGEWRFVEERTGQPITDAVAQLLAALDDSG
ncbi:MAG TPA: hypothetical protein VF761_16100 [Gemmatimonadaceae bacterium]